MRAYRASVALLALVLGVVLAGGMVFACSPAHAWQFERTDAGLLVTRESTDTTANANVNVYYDYRGGADYSATYNPRVNTSYNKVWQWSSAFTANTNTVEVPLMPGGGIWQLVYVGSAYVVVPVVAAPVSVSVDNTPTVEVRNFPATVETTGTLDVSVRDVGGFPGVEFVILAALAAALLGYSFMQLMAGVE